MPGRTGAISQHPPRMRLRISDEDEAELYCYGCHEWLVVSIQFWPGKKNLWRCRACEAERARLYQARKAFDPEHRIKNITKSSRYRAYLKGIDPALFEVELAERRERAARRRRVALAQMKAEAGRLSYKAAWQRARRAEEAEARAA